MKRILTISLLLILSGQLYAEADNGLYVGIGSGFMRTETDLASNALLPAYGDPIQSTDFNKTSLGMKIFAGYRFMDFVGIEAGYFKTFENEQSYCFVTDDPTNPGTSICGDESLPNSAFPNANPLGFRDETYTVEIPFDGYTAAIVGFLPINDLFEIVGKIGGVYTDIDASASEDLLGNIIPYDPNSYPRSPNPPIDRNIKSSGWDELIAVGVNFNSPNNNFTIRAELEWLNITEIDEPWFATLNAIYNF